MAQKDEMQQHADPEERLKKYGVCNCFLLYYVTETDVESCVFHCFTFVFVTVFLKNL